MSIDLSSMTPMALKKLISEATREHKRKKKRAPVLRVRNKVLRMVRAEGYTLVELFPDGIGLASGGARRGGRKTTAKTSKSPRSSNAGRKVAPKYRNPDNPEQTWTGRGKAPLWFAAATEAGRSRDDMLIR